MRALLDDLVAFEGAAQWPDRPIVSAGGSAFFDLVAEALAPLESRATVILRSGAYQIHDAGHYSRISPLNVVASIRDARVGAGGLDS